jgi:nitric oxide reductase subunit C
LIFLLSTAALFSIWVYTSATEEPKIKQPDQAAIRGKMVWQQYNCNACHQLYGLGGYMGPDLTNEISRSGKEVAKAFIIGGTAKMPQLHLSEAEVEDMLAFLIYVDHSGHFPALNQKANIYGNTVTE